MRFIIARQPAAENAAPAVHPWLVIDTDGRTATVVAWHAFEAEAEATAAHRNEHYMPEHDDAWRSEPTDPSPSLHGPHGVF